MAASATAPDLSVKQLFAALERAKKELQPGETLTQVPMFELLGVSRGTFKKWLLFDGFAESGCFTRGAEGHAYAFNPVATIWWLIRYFENERDQRSEKARRAREIAGGGSLAEVPEGFDLKQTRDLVDLSLRAQEMRERSGQLVEAGPIDTMMRRIFGESQVAILTTPQEIDPTGKLSAGERELADQVARHAALRVQQIGRKVVKEERASYQPQTGQAAA